MTRRTILRTDRLVVTSWLSDDLDDLTDLHADPLVMRFIGYGRPETKEETQVRLSSYLAEDTARGWTKWRVEDVNGSMVGRAGFGLSGSCREIAFALRSNLWGRGLATELARALVHWHRHNPANDLTSTELCALVEVGNDASVRVLERSGFGFVGLRDHASGTRCSYYLLFDDH